jgi:hypothetical protein
LLKVRRILRCRVADRPGGDRILDEAHAAGGDIRRLDNLFGLSFETANRYAITVNRP